MNALFSNWRRILWLVFFLALLTRCAFILTQQDGFYFPDSTMDSNTALKLLSAGEFGADFGRAPGYPVFLAFVYFLFGSESYYFRTITAYEQLPPEGQKHAARMGAIYLFGSIGLFFALIMATFFFGK